MQAFTPTERTFGRAVAAAVFIGGGVFAGGLSNLIVSKGYEQEVDDHYKRAIQ